MNDLPSASNEHDEYDFPSPDETHQGSWFVTLKEYERLRALSTTTVVVTMIACAAALTAAVMSIFEFDSIINVYVTMIALVACVIANYYMVRVRSLQQRLKANTYERFI